MTPQPDTRRGKPTTALRQPEWGQYVWKLERRAEQAEAYAERLKTYYEGRDRHPGFVGCEQAQRAALSAGDNEALRRAEQAEARWAEAETALRLLRGRAEQAGTALEATKDLCARAPWCGSAGDKPKDALDEWNEEELKASYWTDGPLPAGDKP